MHTRKVKIAPAPLIFRESDLMRARLESRSMDSTSGIIRDEEKIQARTWVRSEAQAN